ncbi:MAG: DUF3810 domain-containing protein [Bacteroidota bacterium]
MKTAGIIKNYKTDLLLVLLFILTLFFGLHSFYVEKWYATGIYIFISNFLRILLGRIPFSLGDFVYGAAILLIIYQLFRIIKTWKTIAVYKQRWKLAIRKLLRIVIVIYLVFQWAWGLNYHRLGSAYQLNITPGVYTSKELLQLADTLRSKLLTVIPQITNADSAEWQDFSVMKNRCIADYQKASKTYSFLQYNYPSVKKMMIGSLGGYGGFSGYLNPFTGEAQLNENVPPFLRSFITCHEIGHQLGYAAEEEANMIGYIAARQSNNPAVRYSAYHEMMSYASRELYHADSNAYKTYINKLPPLARMHTKQARDYYASFKTPFQTVINQWYDLYLKANSQTKGVNSYSFITAWLIAYAKKYGWENI